VLPVEFGSILGLRDRPRLGPRASRDAYDCQDDEECKPSGHWMYDEVQRTPLAVGMARRESRPGAVVEPAGEPTTVTGSGPLRTSVEHPRGPACAHGHVREDGRNGDVVRRRPIAQPPGPCGKPTASRARSVDRIDTDRPHYAEATAAAEAPNAGAHRPSRVPYAGPQREHPGVRRSPWARTRPGCPSTCRAGKSILQPMTLLSCLLPTIRVRAGGGGCWPSKRRRRSRPHM
jgi:hypothetical protein